MDQGIVCRMLIDETEAKDEIIILHRLTGQRNQYSVRGYPEGTLLLGPSHVVRVGIGPVFESELRLWFAHSLPSMRALREHGMLDETYPLADFDPLRLCARQWRAFYIDHNGVECDL